MRMLIFAFVVQCISAFHLAQEINLTNARVVRFLASRNEHSISIRVNDGTNETVELAQLGKKISSLKFRHGDVVLFEESLALRIMKNKPLWSLIHDSFVSNRVAVYFHPGTPSYDLSKVPVYHWKSPYSDPRSLNLAVSFFRSGKSFGIGVDGFTRILEDIEKEKPKYFFLLGSLYDQESGYGSLEAPFNEKRKLLEQVLLRTGSKEICLDPMP